MICFKRQRFARTCNFQTMSRHSQASRTRLRLTSLEERTVPTLYTVNALTDTNTGVGTTGDLRFCITQANADGQADTIDLSGLSGTINLVSGELPITTTQPLNITGAGSTKVTIAGDPASSATNRIFNVPDGANVTISGLTLTGGNLTSGSSGGAIAMGAATVTLNSMNVS